MQIYIYELPNLKYISERRERKRK